MSKLNVSELDFNNIKANLKSFLQSQTEFQDYNFEGSALSILVDLLSYNTHYLAYIANMSTNEVFLDSADVRNNIVSLAKMIGYTPTSVRAPRADVDILVNNATGSSLTMNKGTVFSSSVSGASFQYVTNEDITITPENGVYRFHNVTLYEGTPITFKYTVDINDIDQRFVIPSANADTSTLKVSIQNSSTDSSSATYSLATGYESLDGDSKVYVKSNEVEDVGGCPDLFSRFSVFASGDVALCSADQAEYFKLGNAIHEDPVKIFNNDVFKKYRDKWKSNNYKNLDYCKDCKIYLSRFHKSYVS